MKNTAIILKTRTNAVLQTVSGHLSACMAPLIPVIIAGSLMKLFCLLVGMTGLLSGTTETILTVIGDTPFYFLPVLVAITAADRFETDRFYAAGAACMLLMPEFTALMEGAQPVVFAGLPVIRTTYAYNILSVILLTWLLSKAEPAARRHFPKALLGTIYPFLVFTVTTACGFLVVGPIGTLISRGLSGVLSFLSVHAGVLAWALLAGIIPLLIPMGMHWIFVTTAITQISVDGFESGVMAAFFIATMALGGADFAVMLRTRDKELRGQALSAGVVALLSGVSEPSLFGVCLREKKALRCSMIAGALVGIYEGLAGIECYLYSFPAFFSILMFHNGGSTANLLQAVTAGVLAVAVSFVLTFFALRPKK